MTRRRRRWLLGVAGALISGALIALVFVRPELADGRLRFAPRFALERWARELPSHLAWLLPFAALTAALPLLRGIVWGFALPRPRVPLRTRFAGFALGGLVHNAAPGRLGLLATAFFVGRRTERPFPSLLSALFVSKLLELLALVVLASVVAIGPASTGALRNVVLAGVVLFCVGAGALVLVARFTPAWVERLEARGRFLRLARVLDAVSTGLGGMRSTKRLATAALVAPLPVMAAGAAYGVALVHLGVQAGFVGGVLLLAAVTLGQLTPGLPVGTGVYYFVCAWAARELGARADDAAALAVLSHAATVVTHLVVGATTALVHRRFVGDLVGLLRRQRRAPA